MKINVYELVQKDPSFRVKLKEKFLKELGSASRIRGGRKYSEKMRINLCTFNSYFRNVRRSNMSLRLAMRIAREHNINKKNVFKNILWFTTGGSKAKTVIPRSITIDEKFVEGFALYLAEGTTGFHGSSNYTKMQLASSELSIIDAYTRWLKKYWSQDVSELNTYIYLPKKQDEKQKDKETRRIARALQVKKEKIKRYNSETVTIPKIVVSIGRRLLTQIFWALNARVKKEALKNKKLARAYLRGLMAGEGTAYFKKYLKYVRIEMRNEKEIKFSAKLLDSLKIRYTLKKRSERDGMWWIYIGHGEENLRRFYKLVGFGCNKERQKWLKKALNSYKQKQLPHYQAEKAYLKVVKKLLTRGGKVTVKRVANEIKRSTFTTARTLKELCTKQILERKKIDGRQYEYYLVNT